MSCVVVLRGLSESIEGIVRVLRVLKAEACAAVPEELIGLLSDIVVVIVTGFTSGPSSNPRGSQSVPSLSGVI